MGLAKSILDLGTTVSMLVAVIKKSRAAAIVAVATSGAALVLQILLMCLGKDDY